MKTFFYYFIFSLLQKALNNSISAATTRGEGRRQAQYSSRGFSYKLGYFNTISTMNKIFLGSSKCSIKIYIELFYVF